MRSPEVLITIELWQLELPDEYFQLHRTAKEGRRYCKEEWSRGKESGVETQAQSVLTLSLDQITKFI
jgi:hypothetical protein